MKKILWLALFPVAIRAAAQPAQLPQQQSAILAAVAQQHVAPREVDDRFSADFHRLLLQSLDPDGLFFTAADHKTLAAFRTSVDDDWNAGRTAFYTALAPLYKARLAAAKATVDAVVAKPFDFSSPDVFDLTDITVAPTDAALQKRWGLRLKAAVLEGLEDVARQQWRTKGTLSKTEVLAREADWRGRVGARFRARLAAWLSSDEAFHQRLSFAYLNTFLRCHDPHSAFFDATAARQFKAGLQTEDLAFGFVLGLNEKGEVCIRHLLPGGAAWQSGALNKDDALLQAQWEGEPPVELSGFDAAAVDAVFDRHALRTLRLTVRKANGQVQQVPLTKQRIEREENVVKSFVLAGDRNIGYLSLPSFYTQWEQSGGSRCAADVATEIVKLKKDSIAGLVLDLRFNGGGSLQEAVEMAGIFLDEGVVCQIKTRDPKPGVMKDMNRGVIWNGPLVVLVNGQSASASEVLAAALQDHQRAVIVGSATYGKATGQGIRPLQEANENLGFINLTQLRLYRPTGRTAQWAGVQPDLPLPPDGIDAEREADEPFALPPDTVARYKYFSAPGPMAIAALRQKSATRLAAKKQASAPVATSERIGLRWEDMEKRIKTEPKTETPAPTSAYRVRNHTADRLAPRPPNALFNDAWLQRLSTDASVEEAYFILLDLLQNRN